jgi:hypothetical protein
MFKCEGNYYVPFCSESTREYSQSYPVYQMDGWSIDP